MSNTQKAIVLLIETFSNHAGKEGDKHTLTKAEMRDLLKNELGELLGKANDQAAVDRIFKELDINQDNTVDFKEFINLVGSLAIMCHEYFCKQ